jgi:hypothetical protein
MGYNCDICGRLAYPVLFDPHGLVRASAMPDIRVEVEQSVVAHHRNAPRRIAVHFDTAHP